MILKIILMVALIKVLLASDQPFLCSGLYAAGVLLMNLLFGNGFIVALIAGGVGLVLASLYFWLLSRFEGSGLLWWGILVVGLGIGLV